MRAYKIDKSDEVELLDKKSFRFHNIISLHVINKYAVIKQTCLRDA